MIVREGHGIEMISNERSRMNRRRVLTGAVGIALTAAVAVAGGGAFAQQANPSPGATPSPVATPAMTKINLNTGTDEQFLTVPGVGDRFVREFKEYRPYTSITQFRLQLGKYVSQDQVKEWEKYVYVPVDPNKADVGTLKQLPGVTDAIAKQLIAGRPYASNAAFLAALAKHITPAQLATAKAYLVTS
jgi:DNA uptake protein ComE-like DNA-binding protein